MFEYLLKLNEEQRQAVENIEDNLLVLSGPGSGKTRTLTHKVRYLIDNGYSPESILCVTFTNKAANEMKHRLEDVPDISTLNISTFHSIGYRLLRKNYQLLGFKTFPTVYTEFDTSLVIESLKRKYKYAYDNIADRISYFKNSFASYEDVVAETQDHIFAMIYDEYREILRTSNAVDFDDLQMYWYRFMDTEEGHKWVKSIKYVLVDEFQDTNTAQFLILEKMHRINPDCKFFVVGDDYQAIYSFRGANINNILYAYERSFAPVKTIYLVKNYRSKPQIVEFSNRVIMFNKNQKHKEIVSVRQENDDCVVIEDNFYSPDEEAKFVVDTITSLMLEYGYNYKDFAVLYRVNSYSNYLIPEFEKRGIPYEIKDFKSELTIGKSNSEKENNEDKDKVQLMSIHASKGLEFKVVFIVGVCDGIFPSPLNENIEEERRLFYVAMTRAMDRLYISSVATIPNTRKYYYGPSEFIEELQLDLFLDSFLDVQGDYDDDTEAEEDDFPF